MLAFYEKISRILKDAIKTDFGIDIEPPFWELSSRQEFGDLSCMAAMKLASQLKKNPLDIAGQLKSSLENPLKCDIEKIEVLKPGYVNIFLSKKILLSSLNQLLETKDNFFKRNLKRKVLLEFCSANPTGPLSIAHGRQAIVGDTIANILKFCGNEVVKEYYINDTGVQIEHLTASVKWFLDKIDGKDPGEFPVNGYRGDYVKESAEYIKSTVIPAANVVMTDKDWKNYSSQFNLRDSIIEHMISLIKKDLESLGIVYDSWVSQQKIISADKVEKTNNFLKNKGFMFEQEGALWFSSTKFGDDKDRVIKKADGELTYFASDIAYHQDKLERGFEYLINLWGPDHHGYIPRVKAALEALGYSRDIFDVIIIQLVTLKSKEKMSKRKGTAILLSELVKEVGKDAARFFYLTRKNSSLLEFDIDLAKELSVNNPLYYIQYSCARIESIFEKAGVNQYDLEHLSLLKEESELNLLRLVLQFFYCLGKAYFSLEPVFIIEYLKNLAAGFHKFYETTKVIVEDKNLTKARLDLLFAVRVVLHCGLDLLGITPAKKM